jgi:predicted metalloprotease
MRWEGREGSSNVEDRRGMGGMGRGAGLGCGGLLVVAIIALLTGADPQQLLRILSGAAEQQAPTRSGPAPGPARPKANDQLGQFASVVLRDTEVTWQEVFSKRGRQYEPPLLVLFDQAVRSACGLNSAAVGPFYCPRDHKVYLDLSFFSELGRRFGAPGDFAAAYVIAHEVGHHVQELIGVGEKVQRARQRASEEQSNQLSVGLELQADCFAGVWGYYAKTRQIIEPGDFEEGLRAAAAIGDDRLQKMGQGYVQPESWTHGSSEQRVQWLRQGLTSGQIDQCDTFRSRR